MRACVTSIQSIERGTTDLWKYGIFSKYCAGNGLSYFTNGRYDIEKIPPQENFSSVVLEIWNSCGIRIVRWIVWIEGQSNDFERVDEMNLYYYHMALNLAKRVRLLPIRIYLDKKFRTQENFGDNHGSYFTAYRAPLRD